jgi:polyisoprenoid-binding protein YceI
MKNLPLTNHPKELANSSPATQSSTWISDPAHSEVMFRIRHLSVSNVHGRIGNVAATILLNETDITQSSVTATIDVGTVDTGEPPRDTHIKSADFFDIANFPLARFTSTSVKKNGEDFTVTGDFTLHGVTQQVVLAVEGPSAPVQGMDEKPHSGFTATTMIKRSAFGIGGKFPAALVGDEVKLTIELEVVKE